MRILMRSYVEDYKIAAAKISFLETYGMRYFFIDNLDKTSMLVIDKENNDKKIKVYKILNSLNEDLIETLKI